MSPVASSHPANPNGAIIDCRVSQDYRSSNRVLELLEVMDLDMQSKSPIVVL
jgi:hypothetical protein